ncbi:CHC2 zinc finger domain-containing protein [Chryseobacterium sp. NKUCC03_KSP]|uniref:CHC2 zinc finger domain-containing protein n=1 Tax=Chryseobacterium sp. NKUCC03_KSP TaxID=2842125 RepID=UPI001C5BBB22|nr:CHC2 zinc finger domain-containing protein [Chryseobacterium sp. NKUCC03_KSP]MBW3521818.1 toprim domain-containing protein [Chryseobacterium sp. NKUCC03_KSP]MBW3521824.1 toprim domain-containing protein [Chryseobacterium sp. NKUCC03_KSP]
MEISAIKECLSLSEVLQHYNLQPKNNMLKCFMHDDKTASLQVNLEKNFYKCHACGKTGDVIQFIEDYEKISKHEAIKKAGSFLKNIRGTAENLGQTDFSGKKSALSSETQSQNIDIEGGTGNLGQTKISTEKSALFLENTFSYFRKALYCSNPAKQYVEKRNLDNSILEIGYNSGQFHHGERKSEELINNALEVGLLQDKGLINNRTGEKGYSIFANKCIAFPLKNKENEIVSFYFRAIVENKNGKHFYLKNRSGIYPGYPKKDTKKLILTEAIIDCASLLQIKEIQDNYSLISCFGTNGFTEEMTVAVSQLKQLEEIIFCFDNDKAGKEAVKKYAENFRVMNPEVQLSNVELPNKDVNETLQLHDEEIFTKLLEERKFIFSDENVSNTIISTQTIQNTEIEEIVKTTKEEIVKNSKILNLIDFLQQKELLQNLNKLIEKSGIIGEENSRLLLFLIIISYLNKNPLHALVQGSSGSGKTHIISRIADLMPPEDVLRFTRITESSLYNWGEFDLFGKVIIIEDLDGLKEEALYSLREFISNQVLRSSVSIKDKKGNNKSIHKVVKGQFSSLSATTKGETYEDNMSRSFLLAVDESKEQTQRIIHYQNRRNAGEIDRNEQEKAIGFIQKLVRNLKHYEVINPYATKLQLPEKVHKIRRLNEMYQAVIKQVTFINQYQREVKNDFLITQIEDVEQATEVLFESIVLKVDELDGSLRQFFEKLKKFIKTAEKDFIQREIRQEFNLSKTQLQRYINTLLELEYIKQVGGYNNTGIRYKVSYWDNYQKLRVEIKEYLLKQIKELKTEKNKFGSPRIANGSQE